MPSRPYPALYGRYNCGKAGYSYRLFLSGPCDLSVVFISKCEKDYWLLKTTAPFACWPTKPKIFTVCPTTESTCQSLAYTVYHPRHPASLLCSTHHPHLFNPVHLPKQQVPWEQGQGQALSPQHRTQQLTHRNHSVRIWLKSSKWMNSNTHAGLSLALQW